MDGSNFPDEKRPDKGDTESTNERLRALIASLEDEAKRRVDLKHRIEQRWIDDLRQYHGLYEIDQRSGRHTTDQTTDERKKSRQFVNLTRTKTNAMNARLVDLLFPTDDRNWGIKPTPVPELDSKSEKAMEGLDQANEQREMLLAQGEQAKEMGDASGMQQAEAELGDVEAAITELERAHEELDAVLREAKSRAELMQEEIDDQLKGCRYGAQARDVIRDACRIGTGIMKGPVVGATVKQRWVKGEDGVYSLQVSGGTVPEMVRVDPWSFFPRMDAQRPDDSESIYERHLMNKTKLRKLAKRGDIDENAIRRLLDAGPSNAELPKYLIDLNDMGEQSEPLMKDHYVVWEYTGPLETHQILMLAEALGQDDYANDLKEQEIDPLQEMPIRAWFCQGEVLAFAEHPMDSGEQLYSVFNLEEDETTMFGFGIPHLMRDSQRALNAAWRMMMDNAGITAGPQIVFNSQVEPVDGRYVIEPWKLWKWSGKQSVNGRERPFEIFNIDNHQVELANIIALARQQMDEVTAMPAIAEGEQGANVTKTAQGMAMLMNSANVVFRRIVKNFDDDMTVPNIRRLYHFNMQFSDKEAIKGDYEVDARGSSVLLVRELQAQNLLVMALHFAAHPVFGPMLDAYNMFKQIIKAHQIAADEVMVPVREYEKNLAEAVDPTVAAAQMQAEQREADRELEREKLGQQTEMANQKNDTARYVAGLQFDAVMNKLAEGLNIEREKLDQAFENKQVEAASKERMLAVEAKMKQATGDSSGGSI